MPSPRLSDPGLVGDGRSVVRDNTASDMFNLVAPVVQEVAVNYLGSEHDTRAQEAIQRTLQESQAGLAALQAPVEAEMNSAVSEYDRKAANINNAVEQGAIGASVAKTRLDALTRDYARRFPAFASEFTGRNTSLSAQAASMFEQDAALAAQKVQSVEYQRLRNMVIDAGRDPNNPEDVALVRLFNTRAAAIKMQQAEQELREVSLEEKARTDAAAVQVEIVGRLGTLVGKVNQKMLEVSRNPQAPGANEAVAASKAELYSEISQLRMRVLSLPANSEEAKSLLSVIESYESSLERVTDAEQMLGFTAAANRGFKSSLERGWLESQPPALAGLVAAGGDPVRLFDSYMTLLTGKVKPAAAGAAAYNQVKGWLEQQLGVTNASPQVAGTTVESAVGDALTPAKPTTRNSAVASQALLTMFSMGTETQALDEQQTNLLFRRQFNLPPGQRLSLGALGVRMQNEVRTRGTNTIFNALRNSPELDNQIRFGIGRVKQELANSRYKDIRIQWAPDESSWELIGTDPRDNKRRVLQRSHAEVVPSEDPAVGAQYQQYPLSGEVRDTLNGAAALFSNGLDHKDINALMDELNPQLNQVQPASQPRQ